MHREKCMIHHIVSNKDKYAMLERDRQKTNIDFIVIEELAGNDYMDASLEEIVVDEALSFCPNEEYYLGVIDFAISKLRKGGSLVIKDIDLFSLCDLAHENVEKFNNAIEDKKRIHTWQTTRTRIRQHNVRVDSVSINEIYYTIKCSKL